MRWAPVAVCVALLGCGGPPIGDCPAVTQCADFHVDRWCSDVGTCTVDGAAYGAGTFVKGGQTVRIPMGPLLPDIGSGRDLVPNGTFGVHFWEAGVTARIDGALGQLVGHSATFRYLHWDPFPASPSLLEIDLPADLPTVSLYKEAELITVFLDGPCVERVDPGCY